MSGTVALDPGHGRPTAGVSIAGRRYPVVLPGLRDPRLHLAAVIITLQVLGQTVLGFELSVAQILVSVATCALIETAVTVRREGVLMWPASALLTGNGVAFILRVPGTRHGDWWSLHGAWIFVLAAALSVGSKYVVRRQGRHVFNPSNIGLVAVFILLGTRRANPQDLWWGPMSNGLKLTLAVIVIGGLTIVSRVRMIALAATFWATFAACLAVVTLPGHAMAARWHVGAVSGHDFWWVLVTSPEILVFLFFMITDPRTSPRSVREQVVFGATVAVIAALLIAPSRTEFETKVAVLSGLAVACLLRPLLDRLATIDVRRALHRMTATRATAGVIGSAAALVALLVVAGAPARSIRTAPPSAAAAASTAAVAARPEIEVDPSSIPPVAVDPAVRTADPGFTAETATRMANDLVADLAIVDDAIRRHDPALVATAATGTALRTMTDEASRSDSVAREHRFTTLTAVLVHDRRNPQAPPRIGLEATGAGGNGTFVLEEVAGHYLVASSDG